MTKAEKAAVAAAALLAACTLLWYGAGGKRTPASLLPAPRAAAYERLDINEADGPALEALPGVGEVLAGRILARRAELGAFDSPEDILSVPGVGQDTLAAMEPYITY